MSVRLTQAILMHIPDCKTSRSHFSHTVESQRGENTVSRDDFSPANSAQWTEERFTEMGFKEAIQKKRQRASEQDAELPAIKLGNQKNPQLQNELQIRVKQLEEQLDEGQRTPGS